MTDVVTQQCRSNIMRKVRSKGNKTTEMRLIELFKNHGITGWRRNYPVKGHPDFVFLRERIAVFVDGCFWHGHDCRNTRPKANREYWERKRARNIERDKEITSLFENRGWTVLRIWECELTKTRADNTIERIALTLRHNRRLGGDSALPTLSYSPTG